MSRRGLVSGSVGIGAAAAAALPAQCRGRIYPGVSIAGYDVSGLTPDRADRLVRERMAGFERHAVTFRFEDREWTASLQDLGIEIDYDSMLLSAMNSVRNEGVLSRYSAILNENHPRRVTLFLRRQSDAMDRFLGDMADDLHIPARDASLARQAGGVEIEPHRIGRRLNVGRAREDAEETVRSGLPGVVDLRVETIQPGLMDADLEVAKDEANRLVSDPLVLTLADLEYYVSAEDLSAALVIDEANVARLDASALEERLSAIERDVARSPRNVMLGWDGGPYVVENDAPGRKLDREALTRLIASLPQTDERLFELPVRDVPAAARAGNIADLGLEGLLGSGSSSFAGSSHERAVNVGVSARNVSYKLVPPGGEFSFNDLLGPITEEYGYIAGSIIQGDFAATDIGGGVCQVSTTVFRAALYAGFRFSEWNPHSWRLAFYEADGSSPGLDAAIYQPNSEWEGELDLRWVNPLDSWLLLVMEVEGDWVSARFYGTSPGWTVEVHPAQVSDAKPLPSPVEKVNPALGPNERRLVQYGQPGYTVRVRRTVTGSDGTVISDGEFVSDYLSQPEAWEVGPA